MCFQFLEMTAKYKCACVSRFMHAFSIFCFKLIYLKSSLGQVDECFKGHRKK